MDRTFDEHHALVLRLAEDLNSSLQNQEVSIVLSALLLLTGSMLKQFMTTAPGASPDWVPVLAVLARGALDDIALAVTAPPTSSRPS